MKARPLGRRGVVVGDRVRVEGDVSGRRGLAGPDRRGPERRDHAAPHRGGRRPGRARDRGQRRPARRGHRAGRPRAAAPAGRPRPRRGVRRRAGAAALPDQGRPGRPRDRSWRPTARSACRGWSPSAAGPARAAGAAAWAGSACCSAPAASASPRWSTPWSPTAMREVGIVNAVTGRGRHTSTSAYMLALPDDDGWIIDTPGHPVLRARARAAGGPDRGVPRPRRDDRRLPARLHARHRRARVRARRGGRRRPARTRTGWRRSGGCWPRAASRRTDAPHVAPDGPGAGLAGEERSQTSVSDRADHDQRTQQVAHGAGARVQPGRERSSPARSRRSTSRRVSAQRLVGLDLALERHRGRWRTDRCRRSPHRCR